MRKITLVADDYGISPAVSAAILELIAQKRLNATSVMVGASEFLEAAHALRPFHGVVEIGLHLTLTRCFEKKPTINQLLLQSFLRLNNKHALRREIIQQLTVFEAAFGFPPDFIDGHQHCHLLPQVSDTLLAILQERGFKGWLRQTGGERPQGAKAAVIAFLSRRFRRLFASFRMNKSFSGAYDFTTKTAFKDIFPHFLQADLIMCHPGRVDSLLQQRDSYARREEELAYFLSTKFLQDLGEAHVIL